MRILLLSSNSAWAHGFSELARVSGWSLRLASSKDEFCALCNDGHVDVLVAESLPGVNLIDALRRLRALGSTCAVVWVDGTSAPHTELRDYAEFADRRVAHHTPWVEWGAILAAQFALLRRHGWR